MPDQPSDQPSDQPPLTETIRAKLDEYDVERHLEELAATLETAVRQGVEAVATLAHDHRDDIGGFLSRTAAALDRRTEGRHAATIEQVRGQLERGVERIAEQRGHGDHPAADESAPDEGADDAGDQGEAG
jgi:RNA-splicing ligase RtcB